LKLSSSVTHFEIYAEVPAKLADFYRGLFGWQVDQAPGIEYWRIRTGAPESQGVGGGLTYRPMPSEDSRAEDCVVCDGSDPEGNIFAIWQADPTTFPPPERSL